MPTSRDMAIFVLTTTTTTTRLITLPLAHVHGVTTRHTVQVYQYVLLHMYNISIRIVAVFGYQLA